LESTYQWRTKVIFGTTYRWRTKVIFGTTYRWRTMSWWAIGILKFPPTVDTLETHHKSWCGIPNFCPVAHRFVVRHWCIAVAHHKYNTLVLPNLGLAVFPSRGEIATRVTTSHGPTTPRVN
jgi:hypothetical protein